MPVKKPEPWESFLGQGVVGELGDDVQGFIREILNSDDIDGDSLKETISAAIEFGAKLSREEKEKK